MRSMDKAEAIRLLGGTPTAAAREVGISVGAVSLWPDPLPPRIADRVQAALWRMANDIPRPRPPSDHPAPAEPSEAAPEGEAKAAA